MKWYRVYVPMTFGRFLFHLIPIFIAFRGTVIEIKDFGAIVEVCKSECLVLLSFDSFHNLSLQ